MIKYIDISKDLLNCVKILGQILDDKDISGQESLRIKYTTKTIEQCSEIIKNSPVETYYIFKEQQLVGKITLDDSNKLWTVDIDVTLCGKYTITPLLDRGKISAFMLECVK